MFSLREKCVRGRDSTHTVLALQTVFVKHKSSLRAISTGQLHTLLHFHLRPINHVVSMGPYLWGNLILKGASRLDAFSVYPVRT